jgi:DNA ligase (NAD+)
MRVNADMVLADCTTPEGIKKAAEALMEKMNEFTMAEREYDTDGVVVKLNIIDDHDLHTELHPKTQWAIKPARVEVETTLIDIEWNMTNGSLVPVAIFEPVVLDGATIQRASLTNLAQIEAMGLYIGARIRVTRRNLVIPHVEGLAA